MQQPEEESGGKRRRIELWERFERCDERHLLALRAVGLCAREQCAEVWQGRRPERKERQQRPDEDVGVAWGGGEGGVVGDWTNVGEPHHL